MTDAAQIAILQQLQNQSNTLEAQNKVLGDLRQDMGRVKGTLESVEKQTIKTNGRVSGHDEDLAVVREDINEIKQVLAVGKDERIEIIKRRDMRREGIWLIFAAAIGVIVGDLLHLIGIG